MFPDSALTSMNAGSATIDNVGKSAPGSRTKTTIKEMGETSVVGGYAHLCFRLGVHWLSSCCFSGLSRRDLGERHGAMGSDNSD